MFDVKRLTLFLRTTHEEIPPLECEDAPGWLSLIQSRDDEVATEFVATSVVAH